MNENLNLVEILKDCPKGTKLYSLICGDVELEKISNDENDKYPIFIRLHDNTIDDVVKDGRYIGIYDGECVLFPAKDQRDWSKFNPKQPKFDPKTLQPFDRVLAFFEGVWNCDLYSHYSDSQYICVGVRVRRVIPYNDDTKHLVGTTDEAPEFYKHLEE